MSISPILDGKELTETFGVDQIVDNSQTDFDLFLRIKDHTILYGGSGYKWFKHELEELMSNGIKEFRVRDEDSTKIEMYLQVARLPMIEKDLAPVERITDIQTIAASFTKMLYQGEITKSCIEKAQDIAAATVDCIAEDPKCIQSITDLANHDYYTYFHSVRVSMYATAVAYSMGMKDLEKLQEIAFGALLHDIGKSEVSIDVINKVGALTNDEWDQMRAHPQSGFDKIKGFVLSHVPREIVLHHHEKLDGTGYPDRLDKNSLLQEVQVVTLADVYDALTSSRSYQKGRTKFEALDFMKQKMIGDKLAGDAFRALIACLA